MSPFDHNSDSNQEGSASTKGGYAIEIEGEIANINLDIEVTKSGLDGSAHGAIYLLGQLPNGEFITLGPTLSKTVKAKVPQGINSDSNQISFRERASLFQDPTQLLTWYLGIGSSESHVFPHSTPDLKLAILENEEYIAKLTNIAVGASSDIADIKFLRTHIR